MTELVIGLVAAWAGSQYPAPEEGWIALTAVGGTHVERVTAFDAFAQDLYAQLRPPGAAVAAAADGHAVNEWVFGSRDVEADLPVTADTVFGIASVAKPFTALAVLLLEERGALAVADPVRTWLPEFRVGGEGEPHAAAVTFHHLLTHTSGLPPEVVLPDARAGDLLRDPDLPRLALPERRRARLAEMQAHGELVATYEQLLDRLAREEVAPLAPPGRVFSYSGEGYALLAAVVERVSRRSFPEFVHEQVLDPLAMTGTGFRPGTFDRVARTHPVAQRYATGYATAARDGEPAPVASPAWWASGRIFGHANMVSTARALLRFATFLHTRGDAPGRRLAARETVEELLRPHAPIPTGGCFGYGLFVRPDHHGHTLVEHAGGGKGCSAQLALLLEPGSSAAALANSTTPAAHRLALGAANALAGLPPDAPLSPLRSLPEHPADAKTLARLTGTYRWHDDEEGISFELRDGALYARLGGQSHECRKFAADGLVVCGPDLTVRFLLDEAGEAWGLSDGARVSRRIS